MPLQKTPIFIEGAKKQSITKAYMCKIDTIFGSHIYIEKGDINLNFGSSDKKLIKDIPHPMHTEQIQQIGSKKGSMIRKYVLGEQQRTEWKYLMYKNEARPRKEV
ncbi:hypothetical protein MTR67_000680 [Solanum verrucosum]|uniref:Uncharacterized protein n=1 Tax=Solanum verrucosum TaxID=315347 RepID=A0AAF0PP27_SOLVR|nr:hypothetical protein MTR67_000680 [Solanum verrucosum]